MPRYRVFYDENDLEKLSSKITIEEQHPAFVVVSASKEVIDKVRKRYPVGEIRDPKGPPAVPNLAGLPTIVAKPRKRGPYFRIVRFHGPVQEAWLQELEMIESEVCETIGSSTIVVKCPNKACLTKLRKLPNMEMENAYVPHIDLSPGFLDWIEPVTDHEMRQSSQKRTTKENEMGPEDGFLLPGILAAGFFTEADQQLAKRRFSRQSIRGITEAGETDLIIDLTLSKDPVQALHVIATRRGLRFLEEQRMIEVCAKKARTIVADHVITPKKESGLGLTGTGEIIAVTDTGLDTSIKALKNKVVTRWSVPIDEFWRHRVENPDYNDGTTDENTGHGTHICGIIAGTEMGIAPDVKLVFQAAEHKSEWNELGEDFWRSKNISDFPPYHFLGFQNDLTHLFRHAKENGARVHLAAWGEGNKGKYLKPSKSLDKFVWRNKDFLVVVAAGNKGGVEQHPTNPEKDVIVLGSISAPGTAKNCLTVGATENDRADDANVSWIKYGDHPDRWSRSPFNDDKLVHPDDIFAMSSRGPTAENRRKPDVVAPGTLILSTRSSQLAEDYFGHWAEYKQSPEDYMYDSGTSMSAALVAGCAVLVRQFLRQEKITDDSSAALIKAIIIHSAQYMPYRFAHPKAPPPPEPRLWWADNEQGWGRVNLKCVLTPPDPVKVRFLDSPKGLFGNNMFKCQVSVTDASHPLRITMVYSDRPGRVGDGRLVNHLNLFADSPAGDNYIGNDFLNSRQIDESNNVEGILVQKPEIGVWSIRVCATKVPKDYSQPFALVISGDGVRVMDKVQTEVSL